jgi:hypothetical protein
LQLGDELLLRSDQRLLLRNDLAELPLAIFGALEQLLKLGDADVSRVSHDLFVHPCSAN